MSETEVQLRWQVRNATMPQRARRGSLPPTAYELSSPPAIDINRIGVPPLLFPSIRPPARSSHNPVSLVMFRAAAVDERQHQGPTAFACVCVPGTQHFVRVGGRECLHAVGASSLLPLLTSRAVAQGRY